MEHRFEYEYTQNEAYVKELLRYLLFKRILGVFIFLGILFVVSIGYTVYFAVVGGNFSSTLFLAFACVLSAVFIVGIYFSSVSSSKKRVSEMFGGKYPTDTAYFTESELHFSNPGGQEIVVDLSNVKKIEETNNIILLLTKAKVLHAFHKYGFTKGTAEELKAFLREKGVK